jgi:hypothetical protein
LSRRALPLTATVTAGPDVLATAFDDELVLLNLRDGVYYGLEGVGARVWSLMQQPTSLGWIRDELVEEFDVAPGRCVADLRALVDDLASRGLAVVNP